MIEAAMIWNEPNNKSHWDPTLDPDWSIFARMAKTAGAAIAAENPSLPRVLGGISPIDPGFLLNLERLGGLDEIDVIALHGFPLDWNLWSIHDWPHKVQEISAITDKPVWITEIGVSSFGADEVQDWGLKRSIELIGSAVARVHWYSLFDLPRTWEATTRHKEAEGSSYYRHFHMGLVREDGTLKPAFHTFAREGSALGICQWFHFEDPRLDHGVALMKELGVRHVRTGLSWADSFRPHARDWFDRQMDALSDFDVTVTFCFTPEHLGLAPHHTSPPHDVNQFVDFCAEMIARYAPLGTTVSRGDGVHVAA